MKKKMSFVVFFWGLVLTQVSGLRVDGVLCCTDCEAFLVYDFGLNK